MTDSRSRLGLSTGIETYVEQAGTGDPALVFLHGGGGWAEHWRLQFDRFAEITTTLMPDLRGHGRSEAPPGRYSLETFADDVSALLDARRIDRPVLVGHSLGGAIALRYAFDYPDGISGIVIVDSGCRTDDTGRDGWRRLVVDRVRDWDSVTAQYSRYNSSPDSGRAAQVAAILAATPETPRAVIHATHYGLITHCISAAASFLTSPALVIGASDSDYWPSIQSWTDYVPHARLAGIPRCGHYVMIEQPDQFNEVLAQFLSEVKAGTAPAGEPHETPPGRMSNLKPRNTRRMQKRGLI